MIPSDTVHLLSRSFIRNGPLEEQDISVSPEGKVSTYPPVPLILLVFLVLGSAFCESPVIAVHSVLPFVTRDIL